MAMRLWILSCICLFSFAVAQSTRADIDCPKVASVASTAAPTSNNTFPHTTVSFLYINMSCIFLSLCFWIGFLCAMFWGKESLPKIAKKHHTVSSFCSNVDDLRLRKTWEWIVEDGDTPVPEPFRGRPEGTTTNYADEGFEGRDAEDRESLIESEDDKRASYDNFGFISSQRGSRASAGSRSDDDPHLSIAPTNSLMPPDEPVELSDSASFNTKMRKKKRFITHREFAIMEFRSKFLIVATTTIGLNLCCLHVEEFNSRPHQYNVPFIIEIVACLLFPLVGLFPTDGGDSRMSLFLGHFFCIELWVPIAVSNLIHQVAALMYFFTFQCTNMYYTYALYAKHDKYFTFFLIVNVISSLIFVSFIGCQVAIRLIEIFSKFRPSRIYFHRWLGIFSFVLEAMMVVIVTVSATLGTIKRNNNVHWFH